MKKREESVPIRVSKQVRVKLKQRKHSPRETYDDVLRRLIRKRKRS